MDDLYNVVKRIIDEPDKKKAFSILYGVEGIELDTTSYYNQIISNFIRKKDLILPKINSKVEFDLDKDLNDIWNIVFIAQYIISYWKKMIAKNDSNKRFYNDSLQKLQKLKIQINSTHSLDLLPQASIEELKKSIIIFQKIRDSLEHANEHLEIGEILKLENKKGYFKIEIPIDYLNGFSSGKVIVKDEDSDLIVKTNSICFPLLEELNYDPKNLESFFYNVDPLQLNFLLEICNNKVENLYRLPLQLFEKRKNFNKVINIVLAMNNESVLSEEDLILLSKLDYNLNDNYADNLVCMIYNFKKNQNIEIDDVAQLARILSMAELNVLKKEKDFDEGNKIINNYYFIKNLINNSGIDKLKLKELPYDLFELEDKSKIEEYVNDIIFIKNIIFSTNNELTETLNYYFNHFIKNGNLLSYLKEVKDIFSNVNLYASKTGQCEYFIDLFLSINEILNLKFNVNKPWIYFKLSPEEQNAISETIKDFKNNHYITHNIKPINIQEIRKEVRNPNRTKELAEIVKQIKNRNITFKEYTDEILANPNKNDYYTSGFYKIRWYEKEFDYLLFKTNNNYELTIEVINRLFDNIQLIKSNEKFYDIDCKEYYDNKIKSNFERNIDFLLSKFSADKLLEYPVEILYSDESLFNYLFEHYNSNLCKSIFGLDNPKLIGTLIYMNSVLSHYNKLIDVNFIDLDPYIVMHSAFNDTIKYSKNTTDNGTTLNQEDYLKQFMYDAKNNRLTEEELKKQFLTKLRNSSAHFRFKIVKDEKGNLIEDKIFLYDEYNDGTNNFNIVLNLKDLISMTRQIEIGIKKNLESKAESFSVKK